MSDINVVINSAPSQISIAIRPVVDQSKVTVGMTMPGPRGPKGDAGDIGPPGVAGSDGEQGPQGLKGDKGDPGDQGLKGDKGDAGDQGAPGAIGPAGTKGDTGDPGPAGAQGPQGIQGSQGSQGPQGLKGDKGDPGDTGPAGVQGIQGLKGDKGDPGDTGPAGVQGIQGPAGAASTVQGPQGPKGDQGIQGIQGPAGADSTVPGPQGLKGDTGDTGPQGPQGIQGIQGEPGTAVVPDVLELPSVTMPAPTAGKLKLFARSRAGRMLLNQIGPSGIDTPLQPALFGNAIFMWLAGATTTVSIAFGTTWTARNTSGAQSHPTKATTNFLTQMTRALFSCTATTATGSGIQSTATVAARGNAANIGGFTFFARFAVETLAGTGQQILLGLSALNAALAGEPSAQANTIAIGKDSTDTNWQIISRNASAVTKLDTGLAVTAGQVLDLTMFCKPGDSKITVRLVRQNDGVVILDDVDITLTLPVNTTFLYAHAQLRNTGTAINALALNRIYVECDV